MKVEKLFSPLKVFEECVVVIDVLRAFTTAAYVFAQGASRIIAVKEIDEAFTLKKSYPNALLMGELHALLIPGFDLGNSPHLVQDRDLTGRTLIQRTGRGTRGVAEAIGSKIIIVASFVVAEATVRRIRSLHPQKVSFLITEGDEDLALADYLEAKLTQPSVDPQPYLERVRVSPTADHLRQLGETFSADVEAAIQLDRFNFAMQIAKEDGWPVIYPMA